MSRDESRDIYQLIVERSGRAPTIVTSNRDTAEWLAAFDETLLAQSAVDRFIHNAYDLVVGRRIVPSSTQAQAPRRRPAAELAQREEAADRQTPLTRASGTSAR
jgi:IstB-like ATP binding protein